MPRPFSILIDLTGTSYSFLNMYYVRPDLCLKMEHSFSPNAKPISITFLVLLNSTSTYRGLTIKFAKLPPCAYIGITV